MLKRGGWCLKWTVRCTKQAVGVEEGWLVSKTGSSCRKQILLYAGRVVVAMVGTFHRRGGDVVTWW